MGAGSATHVVHQLASAHSDRTAGANQSGRARHGVFVQGVLVAMQLFNMPTFTLRGVSAVVVTDDDAALARTLADELADLFWQAR